MGIQDRDWYWEHRDKVQRGEPARRHRPSSPPGRPPEPSTEVWQWRAVVLLAICVVVYLVVDNQRLRKNHAEARALVQRQAQQIQALERAAAARPPAKVEFFNK